MVGVEKKQKKKFLLSLKKHYLCNHETMGNRFFPVAVAGCGLCELAYLAIVAVCIVDKGLRRWFCVVGTCRDGM